MELVYALARKEPIKDCTVKQLYQYLRNNNRARECTNKNRKQLPKKNWESI